MYRCRPLCRAGVLATAIVAQHHSDVWDAAAMLLREHYRCAELRLWHTGHAALRLCSGKPGYTVTPATSKTLHEQGQGMSRFFIASAVFVQGAAVVKADDAAGDVGGSGVAAHSGGEDAAGRRAAAAAELPAAAPARATPGVAAHRLRRRARARRAGRPSLHLHPCRNVSVSM